MGEVFLLQVHRRPRVGVLSTGDELVEPSQQALGPGQIRDANRHMLAAAVRAAGCEVIDLGIAPDDISKVKIALLKLSRASCSCGV